MQTNCLFPRDKIEKQEFLSVHSDSEWSSAAPLPGFEQIMWASVASNYRYAPSLHKLYMGVIVSAERQLCLCPAEAGYPLPEESRGGGGWKDG